MDGDDPISYSRVAARPSTASPRHCLDSPCINIPSPSPPMASPSTLPALYHNAHGHHLAVSVPGTSKREVLALVPCLHTRTYTYHPNHEPHCAPRA